MWNVSFGICPAEYVMWNVPFGTCHSERAIRNVPFGMCHFFLLLFFISSTKEAIVQTSIIQSKLQNDTDYEVRKKKRKTHKEHQDIGKVDNSCIMMLEDFDAELINLRFAVSNSS